MTIASEQLLQQESAARRLAADLLAAGVKSDSQQQQKLLGWLRLLAKWNQACGLTAIPPEKWSEQLIAVNAMALPHLRADTVLDVGSGAGVPGLPLAVLDESRHYTLVESDSRKAGFIGHCRDTLEIDNLKVENCRVEALKAEPYDNIIARAFGPLSKLLQMSWHLSKQKTRWISFKGANANREIKSLPRLSIQSQIVALPASKTRHPCSLIIITRATLQND